MAYEGVSASGGEGLFPQHPRTGDWETLEGRMLAPHLAAPLHGTNSGDARFNGEITGPQGWEAALKPNEPLTMGGGAMAK